MDNQNPTKKCSHCQTDIPLGAKKCPHCQSDLRSFWAQHKIITGFLIFIAFSVLMGVIGNLLSTSNNTSDNKTPTQAKTALSPELKQKSQQALASLTKTRDDIGQVTFYSDPTSPISHNTNNFKLYISKPDDGDAILRFAVSYAGNDWLFVQKYIFNIDGKNYEVVPDEIKKDNTDTVWEWSDDPITNDWATIATLFAHSKVTTIRYVGKQYYHDRTVTDTEKKAIDNVLNAYLGI
jgi:hypothetical protein